MGSFGRVAFALAGWLGLVLLPAGQARAASCLPPGEAAVLPAPSVEQKVWIASRIYDAVERYFAHWEALPAEYDFAAHDRRFIAEAMAAQTRLAFDLAAMRLFGSLANGHTGFVDSRLMCQTLPFRAQQLGADWVVTRSSLPDLAPGDVIVTIDGVRLANWIDRHLDLVRGSNLTASQGMIFARAMIWPERFKLATGDGRQVTVDRDHLPDAPVRGRRPPPEVRTSVVAGRIVRIEIPGFDDPKQEAAAVAAVRAHADAPAILFDLRGNGGGSTPMDLIHTVLEHPIRDMLDASPLHIGTIEAWSQAGQPMLPDAMLRTGGELIQPDHPVFHNRVYLLVDRGCASACEDFVLAMHEAHRGLVLGETTWGSTGQPYMVSFPELAMSFRVSTRREYFPDFAPFEGVGVVPDVPVALTRAMLSGPGDGMLDAAVARIRQDLH